MSRPPTILQVLPALETGGVERGTVDVAVALAKAGWRAVVTSSGGKMVHELERAGVEHVTLPLASKNPFTIRQNATHLSRLIENSPVDIVHARSRAPAWSAYWAAKRTGRVFVTTCHAPYAITGSLKRRYNSVMLRGERVIAISEFIAAYATENYGVAPEKLRVIPRGVDLTKFDPAKILPHRLIELSKQWRLDDGLPVIMLPGRITRWKGHTELLKAIALLKRRDLRVLFVGPADRKPEFRDELVAMIYNLGLRDVVQFVGDCSDMPAALMLADVVVSASTDPEGFGRVAVEAQAMGRPVVATAHGGSGETILDHRTGLLVPPRDPKAMAEALELMLNLGEADRLELAAEARQWIENRFDKRLMCEATLNVYEELLFPGDKSAPPLQVAETA